MYSYSSRNLLSIDIWQVEYGHYIRAALECRTFLICRTLQRQRQDCLLAEACFYPSIM
jgi:hypothetical protein